MKASVYLKSDPYDYEADVEVTNECVVPFRDDPDDFIGEPCGGSIAWSGDYGICENCGASYVR